MHLAYKYLALCYLFSHIDIFIHNIGMVNKRFVVACLVLLVHFGGALAVGNTVKCREKERASLLSLKRGLVDPYGFLSSWGSAENWTYCCSWDNVSCDRRTGHVVGLDLADRGFEGTISPSLAELHHLILLDLDGNNFTPTQFPTFILSLKKLQYLYLSYTNLKGNIPLKLGYLPNLKARRLAGNQLEGGIPKSLASCNLTELDLSYNSLSGQLDDFVASFSHCANVSLQILDLSYNRLMGSVPNFSQFLFLESLILSNNQLNGALNYRVGLLSKLTQLEINDNFLQGVISETHFLRLSQLESLDLSFNDLAFNITPNWIPPFCSEFIYLASCKLGPGFPIWLRTQSSCCSDLDISNAEIPSTMPSWFWDFASLEYMNISHNQIIGEVHNFQAQGAAPIMDFSSNLFEGSIPSNLSQRELLSLDLSNNKFTDARGFLCSKKKVFLRLLDLSNNQLYGALPDCWKRFDSLEFLDVANNSLFRKIPASMGSLTNIRSLHLGFNKFAGKIPSSLQKCEELIVLDVSENDLWGLIPSWIGDGLKKLRVLILRSNMFYGRIPPNICNLSQVQILDLSMNNISGSLPKCVNHLSTLSNQTNFDATISYVTSDLYHMPPFVSKDDAASLVWKGKLSKYQSILGLVKSIDVSSNMLIGEIPSELMDLVGLVSLNISRNMISGQVPAAIGQLKSLDFLDMSSNHLSGHIPLELSQVDRLSVMDLSYNNLSGEIPHGTQLQSFDPSAYAGNAHLCGDPLPKCPTRPTQDLPNDENSEEDEHFFSRRFFISLSIGFGTGFWGICSLIFLNKSFRYAHFRLVSGIYDKVYVVVAINVAKLRRWGKAST